MSRTASAAYLEKLRSPQWQKMRLQIFERDAWTCRQCYATDKTLHAHHVFYRPGREPWDYPLWAFRTLCADCHEVAHEDQRTGVQSLIEALARRQISDDFLLSLAIILDHEGNREFSERDEVEFRLMIAAAVREFEREIPFCQSTPASLPGEPFEVLPNA